ncbi:MAG: helix-turn-helix domain-containing protein [Gammaproteobacteria bacterium]|nr:helix-turn-helix domain-containing protein [Gammaproteobacteria bacterium]
MSKKYPQLSSTLKKLLFEKDMKPSDLAKAVHLPQPTVHRMVTGKSTCPYKKSLKPIADYFSINMKQLLGEENLPSKKTEHPLAPDEIHLIPLLSWNNLKMDNINEEGKKIPFIGKIGKNAFATILKDISMEPIFPRGSILIFDPDKIPQDGSYVLIKASKDKRPFFRQLLIDLDHQYLKPLNPDLYNLKIRALKKDDVMMGTLIESRQTYNKYHTRYK